MEIKIVNILDIDGKIVLNYPDTYSREDVIGLFKFMLTDMLKEDEKKEDSE